MGKRDWLKWSLPSVLPPILGSGLSGACEWLYLTQLEGLKMTRLQGNTAAILSDMAVIAGSRVGVTACVVLWDSLDLPL